MVGVRVVVAHVVDRRRETGSLLMMTMFYSESSRNGDANEEHD